MAAVLAVNCFVCGKIDDKLSILTTAEFDNCVEALQIRLAMDLDMFDKDVTENCHPNCYQTFTDVMSKHIADAKEQEERVLRFVSWFLKLKFALPNFYFVPKLLFN